MTSEVASTAWSARAAQEFLHELVQAGVKDVVISPGSRSQALALGAANLARAGRLSVHVRVDERVAGFTALGMAKETGLPVAVITTSGTAVGNLLPAVMEAFHAGVPLLVLSADRPPELRGIGANQATVQPGIFSAFTRWFSDLPVVSGAEDLTEWAEAAPLAVRSSLGESGQGRPGVAGPVQVNLPFREPFSGHLPLAESVAADAAAVPAAAQSHLPVATDLPEGLGIKAAKTTVVGLGLRTVVVAGAGAGAEAEQISFAGGWPLIAEVVSGARYGRYLVHGYRQALMDESLGGRIQRVIVVGHPTLSREVASLLTRPEIEVLATGGGGELVNYNCNAQDAQEILVTPGSIDRAWLGAWMAASAQLSVDLSEPAPDVSGLASTDFAQRRRAVDVELAAVRRPLNRELLADAVWRSTWPHDRLVFGSSRLVRVADQVLSGKKIPVHANRGLAGIDGTLATALGIALASQRDGAPGITRVLLGDLAFLHDVGALLLPADEPQPRIQLIVGNDGGGTIFDGLEVAQTAPAEDLDRFFYTPQQVDLDHIARAYGWNYLRVTTRSALDQALLSSSSGRWIIEVPLPR